MLHYCDKKNYLIIFLVMTKAICLGQYLQLSNIADNVISFNHASSGINNLRSELGLVYRDQGSAIGPNNYRRLHLYAHTALSNKMGLGLSFNNLNVGEGRSQFINAILALPYHLKLKDKKWKSLSVSPLLSYAQLTHRQAGKFILEENLLGSTGSDVNAFNNQSAIQPGLSVNTVIGINKFNVSLGYEYLIKAKTSVGMLLNEIHKIRATTVHKSILTNVDLYTNWLYQQSAAEHQLLILPSMSYNTQREYINAWNFGVGYRVGDALTFMLGASLKKQYRLYLSYDYTTSGLAAINNGRSAIELGFTYLLQREEKHIVEQIIIPYQRLIFDKDQHTLNPYKIDLVNLVKLEERKEVIAIEEEVIRPSVISHSYVLYHDVNKIGLKSISLDEYKKLIDFIQVNIANIDSIEIISYTDAKGSNDYNYVISSKRARALKSDIIQSGLPQNMVTWKGLGEINLLNDCYDGVDCVEDKHNENRRTVVKVFIK